MSLLKANINQKKTILVIDDDEDDCLILGHALATLANNVDLSCTKTIDHLFEDLDRNQPSLIFIDYHMPKRNGLEVLKQIKDHPDYKDIPVVMWSTSSMSINVMARMQEVPQFFQKPSCYKEFVTGLKAILQQNGIELQ